MPCQPRSLVSPGGFEHFGTRFSRESRYRMAAIHRRELVASGQYVHSRPVDDPLAQVDERTPLTCWCGRIACRHHEDGAVSEFHVFPLGDLVKHTLDGTDCACGPRIDFVPDPDGGDRWIYVHHSLDGREASE